MKNVIFTKQINKNADRDEWASLYLTAESNGYALWLVMGTSFNLISYSAGGAQNDLVEKAVQMAGRPFSEIINESKLQINLEPMLFK